MFEIFDHWYLEASDFLGQFFKGNLDYLAWKEAEMYLGSTAAGRSLLASKLYPSDVKKR